MSRSVLAVEAVHRLAGRGCVVISGRLTGEPLATGAAVMVRTAGQPDTRAVIRGIEFHSAPGLVGVVLDVALADDVVPGSALLVD